MKALRGHGIRPSDVVRLLVSWALATLALALTVWLLPGFSVTSWRPVVVAAAATGLVGMIVRPVLVEVAAAIGWIAVALATLFGQALIMMLAFSLDPGVSYDSFWTVVLASWLAAAFGTFLTWLVSAGTDESFAAALLRTKPAVVTDPDVDGVLFVQLDGVSHPVMRWALHSGQHADTAALGGRRLAHVAALDGAAAVHHAGQPAGSPDGDLGGRPGVPVVRPRARPGAGGQPSRGRRDHRGPGQHRTRPARRRRDLDLQPVHR